mgnify:CR=1 FL=1
MDLKILGFVFITALITGICYFFSYKQYIKTYKHIFNTNTNCIHKIHSKCDHLNESKKNKCIKEKAPHSNFEPKCKDLYVKQLSTHKKLAYILLPILIGLIVASILTLIHILV